MHIILFLIAYMLTVKIKSKINLRDGKQWQNDYSNYTEQATQQGLNLNLT